MKIRLTFTIVACASTAVASSSSSTTSATATATATATLSPVLRGRHHYPPHRDRDPLIRESPKHDRTLVLKAHGKSGGSSGSNHQGCLGYSDSELSQSWPFEGDAPTCSWVHSMSGSNGNGGNGAGTDDSGSYDGNGDTYGGGWDDDATNGGGNDDHAAADDDGDDNDDDASDDQASTDDQVVVSNEDVYGGDDQYDPIEDFNITMCGTYENLWLWDLALSCGVLSSSSSNETSSSYSGCTCSFAEELMENGSLECASASLCPDECQVCSTCLDLLGCGGVPTIPEAWRSLSALSALYILGAAVAMLLFGLLAHYSRKRWRADREDDLDENLMEKDGIQSERQGKGKARNTMYLRGSDLAWRPLPSDQDYAAFHDSQSDQEPQAPPVLQPTYTMSTASTGGRSPNPKNKASCFEKGTRSTVRDPELDTAEATGTATATSNLYGEAVFAQLGANGEPIMVPSMVDTFAGQNHDPETHAASSMGISPIQTLEDSSVSSCAVSSEDEKSETEDPLLEDLSPRETTMGMTSSTGAADPTNEIV